MDKKLAIISTHPIQYYAPVFQLLAKSIDLKVFYTWGESSIKRYDQGFKKEVEWDLPLLDGYNYEFLNNTAKDQGTHHFSGIKNPDLIQTISDFKPDAILVYGWAYKSHLKAIRFFKGKIPIYFRGDSTLFNKPFGLKAIIKSIFLKWVYRHVDFAFYVGTANRDYFKKYGLKESQLVFAPHAIDNNRFAEDTKDEANVVRKKLGIADEDILILFAGKFESKKDPLLLLRTFKDINSQSSVDRLSTGERERNNDHGRKIHLLFVGNGLLETSLKIQGSNLNSKNIHFMDFQNQTQMPVIYQACDLFCLPSQSETWGLAVNEAMACGKAILISDQVGCGEDLVYEGVNGYIFETKNLSDIKTKLTVMLSNKTKLVEMGKESIKIIKNWSFENQVKQILSTINAAN